MKKKTMDILKEQGFQVVEEQEHTVHMARITSDGDTFAYHLVSKETGESFFDYAQTMSFERLEVLNKIAEGLCFAGQYLSGKVPVEKIHDYLEQWHTSNSNLPVYTFLGLTAQEYKLWVETNDEELEKALKQRVSL